MEVHLSAEKEVRPREVATRTGKDAVQLVEEAVDRMLEYDVRFIEAVEEGRASARRGELIEHDASGRRGSRDPVALYIYRQGGYRSDFHRTDLLQATRSEEHTSELQSPCNLVCRLLLEKKKK